MWEVGECWWAVGGGRWAVGGGRWAVGGEMCRTVLPNLLFPCMQYTMADGAEVGVDRARRGSGGTAIISSRAHRRQLLVVDPFY